MPRGSNHRVLYLFCTCFLGSDLGIAYSVRSPLGVSPRIADVYCTFFEGAGGGCLLHLAHYKTETR